MPGTVWCDHGDISGHHFLTAHVQTYILPANASCYRTLGPWSEDEIPEGLKGQHQLKAGSWAEIHIVSGKIDFAWDDLESSVAHTLGAGMKLTVPPLVLHHLIVTGPVEISLSFFRQVPAG